MLNLPHQNHSLPYLLIMLSSISWWIRLWMCF